MDTVFHILSFLYEEEKVPLILASTAIHGALSRELFDIRDAHRCLVEFHLSEAERDLQERELISDLASTGSSRSS